MSRSLAKLFVAAALPVLALLPLSLAAQTAKVVPDFTVFVDPPTGFVFVKLPSGWKFVGAADLKTAVLPAAGVVTSLLEGTDDEADGLAQRTAVAASPR